LGGTKKTNIFDQRRKRRTKKKKIIPPKSPKEKTIRDRKNRSTEEPSEWGEEANVNPIKRQQKTKREKTLNYYRADEEEPDKTNSRSLTKARIKKTISCGGRSKYPAEQQRKKAEKPRKTRGTWGSDSTSETRKAVRQDPG